MHSSFPSETPIDLFFQNNFESELVDCLHELTGSLVNKAQLIGNFSPNIADAVHIN
jgi:3-dehydroquinate dehydratase